MLRLPTRLSTIAILTAVAPGGTALAQAAPRASATAVYGPTCGPVLAGEDIVFDGTHQWALDVRGAGPNGIVALFVGDRQIAVSLPSGCALLTEPLVGIPILADANGAASVTFRIPGELRGSLLFQAIPVDGALRSSNGLRFDSLGSAFVQSVTPRSGAEGELIVILGSGFDPNAAGQFLTFGDSGAFAEVVTASPTRLVARIGAVPTAGTFEISLVAGERHPLPTGQMVLAGVEVQVPRAEIIRARHQVPTGVKFQLTATTPKTVPGVPTAGGLGFDMRHGLSAGRTARLESWRCLQTRRWTFSLRATIDIKADRSLTPGELGRLLADYLTGSVPDHPATYDPGYGRLILQNIGASGVVPQGLFDCR